MISNAYLIEAVKMATRPSQIAKVIEQRDMLLADNTRLRSALRSVRKDITQVHNRVGVGALDNALALIGLAAVTIDTALSEQDTSPEANHG